MNRLSLLRSAFLVGLVAACGSASDSRHSPKGGEAARVGASRLSASPDLPTALQGRVQSPPRGTVIGASTKGEPIVAPDGSTSYKIPIWVPDGVRGVQPTLAINYESDGSFGLLGRKWGISGLSSIRHCAKTRAQDNGARPIDFQAGEFCLDGERLLLVNGSSSEYRTEKNPFSKIVATSGQLPGFPSVGVLSFQVFQPNGLIYSYGQSAASRLQVTPREWFLPGTTSIATYYLDKVQDRFGNSIRFSYSPSDATNSEMSQLVPTKIQWGGTGDTPGQRSIDFTYVGGTTAGDHGHEHWSSGLGIMAGQRLDNLTISGPDGLGSVVTLKQYRFGYNAPTISGEQLLALITECDGNGVCKKPTRIGWESGSWQYTPTNLTASGVDDVGLPATLGGPHADWYRRILVADLNRDGRDDIVYRSRIQAQTSGHDSCLGWSARLAQADGTFGAAQQLWTQGGDSDPSCNDPATTLGPSPEDLVFADVNRDGFPDMVSPVGNMIGGSRPTPAQRSYGVYLNSGLSGNTFDFGERVGFEDSRLLDDSDWCNLHGNVNGRSPMIAVGDVDGDGYPEILRPNWWSAVYCGNIPAVGGLTAFSIRNSGGSAAVTVTTATLPASLTGGTGLYVTGLATLDADSDGTVEVLVNHVGGDPLDTAVVSPTIDGTVTLPPPTMPQMNQTATEAPKSVRWVLDLNGDGLKDLATIYSSDPNTIVTNVSTGKGFSMTQSTTLAAGVLEPSWQNGTDPGVRVVDYNLDGRQDLVLMDNGTPAGPLASQRVLLSDGTGKFTLLATEALGATVPVGDPASGYVGLATLPVPGGVGFRTSVSLDVNGDGLPDFLQLEGGQLMLYTRQGKMPDFATSITEGTGRKIAVAYAPSSDTSVHQPDLAECANDLDHLSCLVSGRMLTQSLTISGVGSPIVQARTFKYMGGVSDRGGLGFLGFEQRDVYGPASLHVTELATPAIRQTISTFSVQTPFGAFTLSSYTYPNAFRPWLVQTQVDTPQGPNSHHITSHYAFTTFIAQNPSARYSTYSLTPWFDEDTDYDCPPGPGDGVATGCGGEMRLLSYNFRFRAFDEFGNTTSDSKQYYDENGLLRTDTETRSYTADTTGSWLVQQLNRKQITSSTAFESVTRTTNYTTDLTTNSVSGYPIGVVNTEEVEPAGDASVHLLRTFGRDERGRLTSLSEAAFPTPGECSGSCSSSCTSSCQANCAGAGPNMGQCMGGCMGGCMANCVTSCSSLPSETRTTGYSYEDADGVYVTTTTDALHHQSRVRRHPGYGFIVEADDPNGAAAVTSYDTFGRVLGQTAMNGASSATTYKDIPPNKKEVQGSGSDFEVSPEDKTTRTQRVHLDAFGNETSRVMPIDGSRTLTTIKSYDALGRPSGTRSIASSSVDPFAYDELSYDDLGRLLSKCRLVSADNGRHCKTYGYDGLEVTITDESGRQTTRTADGMGRTVAQSADLAREPGGGLANSTASYTYGPFGVLEREATSEVGGEITGETDLTYDLLGRRTSLQRAGMSMVLITTYNGFGNMRTNYKLNPSTEEHFETQTFSYDSLGRVLSETSQGYGSGPGVAPPLRRRFYWDKDSPNDEVPKNSEGRLNDIVDSSSGVSLHFEYDQAGHTLKKAWRIFNPAAGATETYDAQFSYDSQGRLDTLTYPLAPNDAAAPMLQNGYDPYLGAPASVSRLDGGAATTLWSVTARNELGEPTSESMSYGGGPAVTRATNYFLQDGRVRDSTLRGAGGSNPAVQLSYTYEYDGLPASFGVSSAAGTTSATFGYDNLGRLISWEPAWDTTVSWAYDGDGNMTARNWSSGNAWENVSYSTQGNVRIVSASGSGHPDYSDTYRTDGYGRIWDTPAISIWTTDEDRPGFITEKATGQVDQILYDGTGRRVFTLYGDSGSAGTLLELDDLFELKVAGATEARYRVRAGEKLIGDIVKSDGAARTATFYLEDNTHSVIAEASSSGEITVRAARDPFGNLMNDLSYPDLPGEPGGTDPDGSSRLGFGGHERDPNFGMVDMLARTYSPRLGGFMGPDPLVGNSGDRRSFNPFAYVRNSPTAGDDPLGAADDLGYTPYDAGDLASYQTYMAGTDALMSQAYMSVDDRPLLSGVEGDFGTMPRMSFDDGTCGLIDGQGWSGIAPTSPSLGASELVNDAVAQIAEMRPSDYFPAGSDSTYRLRVGGGLKVGPFGGFFGLSIDSNYDISLFGEASGKVAGPMSLVPSFKVADLGRGYNQDGFRFSGNNKLAVGPASLSLEGAPAFELGSSLLDATKSMTSHSSSVGGFKGEFDFSLSRWSFDNIYWPIVQPMYDWIGVPERSPTAPRF